MKPKTTFAVVGVGAGLFFGPVAHADPPLQGSDQCIQGSCTSVAAENSVNWAAEREGSTAWDGLCQRFVREAYAAAGIDIGHAPSAIDYWNAHPDEQQNVTPIPRGALVFWGATPNNPYGHVAIATGDGNAWSTDERGIPGVHLMSIDERNQTKPYLGYIVVA